MSRVTSGVVSKIAEGTTLYNRVFLISGEPTTNRCSPKNWATSLYDFGDEVLWFEDEVTRWRLYSKSTVGFVNEHTNQLDKEIKYSMTTNSNKIRRKAAGQQYQDDDEDDGEVRGGGGGIGSGGGTETARLSSWTGSQIFRVSRASGGKDRHSKVLTAKGLRDKRVLLSVATAIQFYDLQDRLGYDRPSKAVEWLIKASAEAIAKLPSLSSTFPETPKPSDERRSSASQPRFDPAELELETEPSYQQQHHHMSLTRSGGSSTSETSKGSGLSLSRSEIRVKARERARERAAKGEGEGEGGCSCCSSAKS